MQEKESKREDPKEKNCHFLETLRTQSLKSIFINRQTKKCGQEATFYVPPKQLKPSNRCCNRTQNLIWKGINQVQAFFLYLQQTSDCKKKEEAFLQSPRKTACVQDMPSYKPCPLLLLPGNVSAQGAAGMASLC